MSRRALVWLAILLLGVALVAIYPLLLSGLGHYLVKAGPPCHADLAVVLGGDWYGDRVLVAADLARQGYVPKVLVSGPSGFYGKYESDLAIPFATAHGYPAALLEAVPNEAHSTQEEAQLFGTELHRRGVKRFMLVTSDFHTRRAQRTFSRAIRDIPFCTVAAKYEEFTPDGWWKTRQGRKTFLFEWMKTAAEWVGL